MTCIIAEIGQAHDGSLGILHAYIDAVAEAGADAIKFQTHIALAESSVQEPFRVEFSMQDRTRFDYWRRMEFDSEQWRDIGKHCARVGLEFISSPFSNAAVDLLEEAGVDRFKVGSGEVSNLLLLERLALTGKHLIVSSGMSDWDELDQTTEFLRSRSVSFSLLQCTSLYPSVAARIGLNVMHEIRQRYDVPTGISDHSGTIFPSLAAATLGADLIEIHVVFDKRMFGPDVSSSVTIDELGEIVQGVRYIEQMHSHPVDKNDLSPYREIRKMFGKSLAVNRSLPTGHVLQFADLDAKKPAGCGISASQFNSVLNRRLSRPMDAWEFLTEDDLE